MAQNYGTRDTRKELKDTKFLLKDVAKRITEAKKNGDVDELEKCTHEIDAFIDHLKKVKLNGYDLRLSKELFEQLSKGAMQAGAIIGLGFGACAALTNRMKKTDAKYRKMCYDNFRNMDGNMSTNPDKLRYGLELTKVANKSDRRIKSAEALTRSMGANAAVAITGGSLCGINSMRIDQLQKNLDKQIKKLEDMSRELKAEIKQLKSQQRAIKESVEDIKLEIYESCRYGEISEEEMEILLNMI
jgi:cell division protein FtsB